MHDSNTNSQPAEKTPQEHSLTFALIAYDSARSEMLFRLDAREQLLRTYLIGSISILVALISGLRLITDFPEELFFLSPTFALIVSIQLKNHIRTNDRIAHFLRHDLSNALIHLNAWAPHWDWHTQNRAIEKAEQHGLQNNDKTIEAVKTPERIVSQLLSIHLPSFICILTYAILQFDQPSTASSWSVFVASLLFFFGSVTLTTSAYGLRKYQVKNPPPTAKWWTAAEKNKESTPQ